MCVVYETGEGVSLLHLTNLRRFRVTHRFTPPIRNLSLNMPQAGFYPPAQSHTSYETSPLPQSHHGWTCVPTYGPINTLLYLKSLSNTQSD